jgi:Glyoxalase-like domain
MPTRLVEVAVDAADPAALARWWAQALGWAITLEEPGEVEVGPRARTTRASRCCSRRSPIPR